VLLAAAAARGLGAAGDRGAREALEALLEEDHPQLREAAAEALGLLGDPAAADALAKAAVGGSVDVGAAVIDALVALPQTPDVGSALCRIAEGAVDPGITAHAAREARLREGECS